jgi:hypothetical protein
LAGKSFLLDDVKSNGDLDHHNWGSAEVSPVAIKKTAYMEHPLLCNTNDIIKQYKKKKESFVGLSSKIGSVRATLRKKFSWKSYPELENYLLDNQKEYFRYSSRNYTPEQVCILCIICFILIKLVQIC